MPDEPSINDLDNPGPIPREEYAKKENMGSGLNEKPHPWRRLWARLLDYLIYGFVLGVIFALCGVVIPPVYWGVAGIGLIFFWTFIEAGFLSTWGTTPGKALLSMHVRKKDGTKLSYLDGINRSFSVWWLGVGAAIYPITIITMIVACTKLSNLGETTWDKKGEYTVSHGRVGPLRVIIVVVIFVILLGLAQSGTQG